MNLHYLSYVHSETLQGSVSSWKQRKSSSHQGAVHSDCASCVACVPNGQLSHVAPQCQIQLGVTDWSVGPTNHGNQEDNLNTHGVAKFKTDPSAGTPNTQTNTSSLDLPVTKRNKARKQVQTQTNTLEKDPSSTT